MTVSIENSLSTITDVLIDIAQHVPTLRDQFAMAAATGMLARGERESVAREAFLFADAMLKARER